LVAVKLKNQLEYISVYTTIGCSLRAKTKTNWSTDWCTQQLVAVRAE
jgi:hypothetical protein